MYPFVLSLHNIFRWLVLFFGVLAVIRAYVGWFGNKEWTDLDNRLGLGFTVTLDVQILLGLLLFFVLSPITSAAFSNIGEAMSQSGTRYFLVEHSVGMLVAVVLAHIGRSRAKKADTAVGQHKQAAIFFTISLIVILISIPWFRSFLPF